MQSVVIHAHFYQPPREDPWLEVVEREHSASPWHDWNLRIEHECYRPVVAARLVAPDGRILRIVNLLEQVSFNVGATLLEWLEQAAPATYAEVLRADAVSRQRLGHGNALAMPYHHVILPLASRRDKVTEVRWGIRDFRRRFGREPEGMWLPETAADDETLDVLAQEGIRFTVLAPHQVSPMPLYGLPGVIRTTGHRRLAVFTYDGALAHDVAFGPVIRDPAAWAARMELPADDVGGPKLVALATDGETYGHHHRFGEMALAAALDQLASAPVRIENFASFLAAHPPRESVTLTGPGSWSCSHGVERWRADCGCRTAEGTSQAWRAPMRDALEWLKGVLDARFEEEGTPLFEDPWTARDLGAEAAGDLPVRAHELLEMQRNGLRMFTSCGWFFDDIAGLEPLQCLRYAARAIDFTGAEAAELRETLRTRLSSAHSNDPTAGDGATLFDSLVVPAFPPEIRVGAGVAALSTLLAAQVPLSEGVFDVVESSLQMVTIRHRRTGRTWRFGVSVQGRAAAGLLIDLTDAAGVVSRLTLADLPEPSREALRRHAQASLLPAVLDQTERDEVAAGVVPYGEALERAMLRHLDGDAAAADVDGLTAALDLLAMDRRPVPFDVQTSFYRLYRAASPTDRARLNGLLGRFGFADALAEGEA